MKNLRLRVLPGLCIILTLIILLVGCSGGGGGSASTGTLKVSVTDAPTTDLDHVWVTVREIRFHTSQLCDDPDDGGWLRYPLATPVSVDLAALNNGVWSTLWDSIVLPVGNYQQIRVILAGTNEPLAPWAAAKGLIYNNQVVNNGSVFPLVIPAAKNGIKLIGSFRISEADSLHIVIDFDVTHDVVETGSGKYILKPRLKYFFVSTPQTAAINGTVRRPNGDPFANYTGVSVVIKAESPVTITFANTSSMTLMELKRSTTVRPDGTFVLYPLPAEPGKTYDLVVRGSGITNMVLRNVPATPGTTKDDPSMFEIYLTRGNEYLVNAQVLNEATNPYEPVLGASVAYYQTPPGEGEIPHLIRFSHVDPLFGTLGSFPLASGLLQAGTYNPTAIFQSFSSVDPKEGPDTYAAYASAPFFWTSGPKYFSPVDTFNSFLLYPLIIPVPPVCDMDDDNESNAYQDKGYYVVCGGLVVDHIRKLDLENGGHEFQSANTHGQDIKFHGKGDKVKLDNRMPIKIKVKFKK